MLVLAHAGHWLANVLYAAPLVALAVAMGVGWLRDRGRDRDEPAAVGTSAGRGDRRGRHPGGNR
jgi:hypothetical protein